MKKLLLFAILIIFVLGCESPLKIKPNDSGNNDRALFNRSELCDAEGFGPGYSSGNIRTSLINLSWNRVDSEDFCFYKLLKDGQPLLMSSNIYETTYTDSLLEENQEYFYQLVTYTTNGLVVQDSLTLKTPKWQMPSNLQANGFNSSTVLLTWDDNSESESCFIVNCTPYLPGFGLYMEENVTEKLLHNLSPELGYSFTVYASNQWEGDTQVAGPYNFNTTEFELVAPSELTGYIRSDGAIVLDWQDNSTMETGFFVKRKINDSFFEKIADLNRVNVTSYIDIVTTAFPSGAEFTYLVQAYNDYEHITETLSSNQITLVSQDASGFEENFDDNTAQNWLDDGSGLWNVTCNTYQMYSYQQEPSETISYFNEEFSDFSFEADLAKVTGSSALALYFRGDGDISGTTCNNGYIFDLLPEDGKYAIFKFISGELIYLVQWTNSELVNGIGETNHVKVVCTGPEMQFYLNGELVENLTDNTFSGGYVGFWSFKFNNELAQFDNARLIISD